MMWARPRQAQGGRNALRPRPPAVFETWVAPVSRSPAVLHLLSHRGSGMQVGMEGVESPEWVAPGL